MEDLLVPMLLATLAVGALSAELMGDVVSAIEERVLGMKPQSCALVFVGRFPGLQPEAYYARITYWLSSSSKSSLTEAEISGWAAWLDKTERCVLVVVLLLGGEGPSPFAIPDLVRLAERVPKRALLLGGVNDTAVLDVSDVNTPFVAMKDILPSPQSSGRKRTVRLKTFCPNVTDPWVESPNNVWMSDKGLMSKTPLLPLTKACPHPLKGKLLKVTCMKGSVPFCINVQDEEGRPTGVFKGLEVEILRMAGAKMGFRTRFMDSTNSRYNRRTRQWTEGTMQQIITGEADFAIATFVQLLPQREFADALPSSYLHLKGIKWAIRHPIPIDAQGNVMQVFSALTWSFIFVSLLCLSVAFALLYYVYDRLLPDHGLAGYYVHKLDFLILPVGGLAQQEPFPWFTRMSAGQLLSLAWSLFAFALMMFYSCNLRANLTAIKYEPWVNSNEDILLQNRSAYLPRMMPRFRIGIGDSSYGSGPQGLYRVIAEQTHAQDKYFGAPGKVFHLDDKVLLGVLEDGDVMYMDEMRLIYLFVSTKGKIGMHKYYLSRDEFYNLICVVGTRRHQPWAPEMDEVLRWIRDTGHLKKPLVHLVPPRAMDTRRRVAGDSDNTRGKLQIASFDILFYYSIGGVVVAAAVFASEVLRDCAHKMGKDRRRRRQLSMREASAKSGGFRHSALDASLTDIQ